MNLNKAAMFGLDARIALAIFAALSVISGAALYKVMDEVKATQYHAFFEEIAKAAEAYYLDNGVPLEQNGTSSLIYGTDLLENRKNLSTWKGPYINNLFIAPTKPYFKFSGSAYGGIYFRKVSDWPGIYCNVNDEDCAEYVAFHADTEERQAWALDVFNKLDKKIDNSDGANSGKIRHQIIDAANHYVYYQGMRRKKPS
jgi:hypothetical protein